MSPVVDGDGGQPIVDLDFHGHRSALECRQAGDGPTHDQRVDFVGALVGAHTLQVAGVPARRVLQRPTSCRLPPGRPCQRTSRTQNDKHPRPAHIRWCTACGVPWRSARAHDPVRAWSIGQLPFIRSIRAGAGGHGPSRVVTSWLSGPPRPIAPRAGLVISQADAERFATATGHPPVVDDDANHYSVLLSLSAISAVQQIRGQDAFGARRTDLGS